MYCDAGCAMKMYNSGAVMIKQQLKECAASNISNSNFKRGT